MLCNERFQKMFRTNPSSNWGDECIRKSHLEKESVFVYQSRVRFRSMRESVIVVFDPAMQWAEGWRWSFHCRRFMSSSGRGNDSTGGNFLKSIKRVFYALVLVLTFVFPAASALGKTMKETVTQAVLTNPDVQAAWHAFRAAQAEQEAARGGYLPKVDVAVSAGWENLGGKAYRNRDQHNYFREGAYLTLSQMIYDGGMTRSQAKKFGYAKNAKYYDLLSSIEKVALLAFRSHDDVNRYREMIRLAQLNLKRHEEIMKKVEARSRAGIDSLLTKSLHFILA